MHYAFSNFWEFRFLFVKMLHLVPIILHAVMAGQEAGVMDNLQLPEYATTGQHVHLGSCGERSTVTKKCLIFFQCCIFLFLYHYFFTFYYILTLFLIFNVTNPLT